MDLRIFGCSPYSTGLHDTLLHPRTFLGCHLLLNCRSLDILASTFVCNLIFETPWCQFLTEPEDRYPGIGRLNTLMCIGGARYVCVFVQHLPSLLRTALTLGDLCRH